LDLPPEDKPLVIAGRTYKSRLIVGTGKYKTYEENARALEASGAEMVTVAVRRVNLTDPKQPRLIDFIDPKKYTYLPNTAGCFTGEDAVRTLRLAREAGGWTLVKLEVLGNKKTLYPDMIETLRATEMLLKEGFQVMVYASDDPLMAKRLEDVGAVAVMPLASPIGSGMGIQSTVNIRSLTCAHPEIIASAINAASISVARCMLHRPLVGVGQHALLLRAALGRGVGVQVQVRPHKHGEPAMCLAGSHLAINFCQRRHAQAHGPELPGVRRPLQRTAQAVAHTVGYLSRGDG